MVDIRETEGRKIAKDNKKTIKKWRHRKNSTFGASSPLEEPIIHHVGASSSPSTPPTPPYHRPKSDKPFLWKASYKIHIGSYKQMSEEINKQNAWILVYWDTTYMYIAFISNCVFVTRFRDAYTLLSIHCHLHHQSGVIPPASSGEVIFEWPQGLCHYHDLDTYPFLPITSLHLSAIYIFH